MELEEAINRLKYANGLGYENHEAIETVLQELENKDKEIQDLKAINAMQEYRINEMDIPKKKIEDKIEELDDEFNSYQVNVNCTQDGYYIYFNEYVFVKETLQELLEDNK